MFISKAYCPIITTLKGQYAYLIQIDVIMKRLILCFIQLCLLIPVVSAYDFALPNHRGDSIFYKYIDDGTKVTVTTRTESYQDTISYVTDTLFIPDTIIYNGKKLIVTDIEPSAFGRSKISVIVLPKTLNGRKYYESYQMGVKLSGSFINNEDYNLLTSIEVDEENPFFKSFDGVLYTATMDTLLFYPPRKEGTTYHILEGTKYIGFFAFVGCPLLDSIVMPEGLVDVSDIAFAGLQKVKTLRFPNSITKFSRGISLGGTCLDEVIFGSGLTYMGRLQLSNGTGGVKRVVCLAVTPPTLVQLVVQGLENITLFVPRKSINAYKQHPEWNKFYAIEPIEPPVISGVNSAEISWVTNADAYSYTLTLYLDSEQTRRLMTLTFDEKGYLTNMDINTGIINMPSSMPNHVRQAVGEFTGEDTPEYNSYLSFTVTGLSANTEYFYVRKTYNALGEIIDEETGSFETQSNGDEGLEQNSVFSSEPQKMIKDGQVYLHHKRGIYSIGGNKVN